MRVETRSPTEVVRDLDIPTDTVGSMAVLGLIRMLIRVPRNDDDYSPGTNREKDKELLSSITTLVQVLEMQDNQLCSLRNLATLKDGHRPSFTCNGYTVRHSD